MSFPVLENIKPINTVTTVSISVKPFYNYLNINEIADAAKKTSYKNKCLSWMWEDLDVEVISVQFGQYSTKNIIDGWLNDFTNIILGKIYNSPAWKDEENNNLKHRLYGAE